MSAIEVLHSVNETANVLAGVIPNPDPVQPPGTEGVTTIL